MKAAQIKQYGSAANIEVVDIDRPTAGEGQIVVEVGAASLNSFDTIVREGYMQEMVPLELPVTLGGDIAGTVVEVGEGVSSVKSGDTVYGQANVVAGNSGAFAEYSATSANQIAPVPAGVSIQQAASLPLVGVSALQALTDVINLQADQKILITGGAGGIGRIAIQIAKHLGGYVAATASAEDLEALKSLGADEVFDYANDDYTTALSDYDAAFDTAGGDELSKMVKVLKPDGIAVSMAGQPAEDRDVKAVYHMTQVTTDVLTQLSKLVESGIVTPLVGQVFTLDEAVAAFEARESGSVDGKVVLAIK